MRTRAKAGWLVRVQTGEIRDMQPVYDWFIVGYSDERLAEGAVKQKLRVRPSSSIKAERQLAPEELIGHGLRSRQVKYYVRNP
jgi:hypothetical protein